MNELFRDQYKSYHGLYLNCFFLIDKPLGYLIWSDEQYNQILNFNLIQKFLKLETDIAKNLTNCNLCSNIAKYLFIIINNIMNYFFEC